MDDMTGSRHCIGALYLGSGWEKARGLWKEVGTGAKGLPGWLGWIESEIAMEGIVSRERLLLIVGFFGHLAILQHSIV